MYNYTNNNDIISSNNLYNSMEHIYEEVICTTKTKSSHSTLKKTKQKIYSVCKIVKNKISNKNPKNSDCKNFKNSKTKSNMDDDYDYVCYSVNSMSSEQKKQLQPNSIGSKLKRHMSTFKKKHFSKKENRQLKTNLKSVSQNNVNANLSIHSSGFNNYKIKNADSTLDDSGYEVPICQQKQYLKSEINENKAKKISNRKPLKKDISLRKSKITNHNPATTINFETQHNVKTYAKEFKSNCLTDIEKSPKNLETSPTTDNTNNQTQEKQLGIVQKRISLFEGLQNIKN